MTRRNISFIDYSDTEEDPIMCPFCLKVGINNRLVPQYYNETEIIDPDNYLQCPKNGNHLIPIYEGKSELSYEPIVDLVESPFDQGSRFAGVEPRSKKHKKRKAKPKLNKNDVFASDVAAEHGDVRILYDSQGNY